MMSVVHAPFGNEPPSPPAPSIPSSVELYEPPARIGGGWGSGTSDEAASRERTQRTLNRAKTANAQARGSSESGGGILPARAATAPPRGKCSEHGSHAAQVPIVVHVPLPDLDQPVVAAAPNEVRS